MIAANMDPSAAAERIWPGRPARVAPLSGGITNHNFRVDVDGRSYVLRMGGAKTHLLGIDRGVERAAAQRASEVGIGPAVEAYFEAEAWLVTKFIDGRPIPGIELPQTEAIRRVAGPPRPHHAAQALPGRLDAHPAPQRYP